MSEPTKGPWKAKRLVNYQEPGWVVLWPDKGGTHMRRLDYKGNFTGPDAALIAAAPEMLRALVQLLAEAESLRESYSESRKFEGWDAVEEEPCFALAREAIAKALPPNAEITGADRRPVD